MSAHYKRFLKLLEKWPVDNSNLGRDLGQYLRRSQIQSILGGANIISENDNKKLDKQLESLENLANNVYFEKYPRKFKSTSTGLTGEQCRQILSSEVIERFDEDFSEDSKK